MKRLFSSSQKKHLYVAAGGRCEMCSESLGNEWEAHHITRHADGGVTEVTNGMALCRSCHQLMHRRTAMPILKPRGWQRKALPQVSNTTEKTFLLEACPGAGKTIFSGLAAKAKIDADEVDFVLVVVPTTALKGDKSGGFLADWHKCGVQLTPVLKTKGGTPPKEYDGAVVTYAQLPNLESVLRTWASLGVRLMTVFDEVHHASDSNTWGTAAEAAGDASVFTLAMTGTPFRGDGRKISFVNYSEQQNVIPDYKYTYRSAVADQVCREVYFAHDNGVADYVIANSQESVRISEAANEQVGRVASVIFNQESEFLKNVIQRADAKLDEYQTEGREYAPGGIVICRPGVDDNDDRHLHQVAKTVQRITGEMPIVITHDDPEANNKISEFRNGKRRWICSVRKISEGVDIKRLRVQVLACVPGTELLFRQLVGRVVRVVETEPREEATVFMARFAKLEAWAKRIEAEAEAGIRDSATREQQPRDDRGSVTFLPLNASHEIDGGVANGEQFSAAEINHAERFKAGDPKLAGVSVSTLAHILRRGGVEVDESDELDEPLHEQKKKLRSSINKLVRKIAIQANRNEPAFGQVWATVHKRFGVRSLDDLCDNHPIPTMAQVEQFLIAYMGDDHATA